MIPLIPYQRWTIYTPLSRSEAVTRLSAKVSKRTTNRSLPRLIGSYEGNVSEKGFNIYRIVRHEHSFLPVVRGKFVVKGDQLRIDVLATLHTNILVFLLIALILIMLSGLFGHFFNILKLLIVASPFYVILQIAFIYELYKVRRFLDEVFAGQ